MKNKDLNKKEKAFKKVMKDFQMDINTDEIWNNIENRIPSKPNKKYFLWFGAVGIFLFISVLSTYLYLHHETQPNPTINTTITKSNDFSKETYTNNTKSNNNTKVSTTNQLPSNSILNNSKTEILKKSLDNIKTINNRQNNDLYPVYIKKQKTSTIKFSNSMYHRSKSYTASTISPKESTTPIVVSANHNNIIRNELFPLLASINTVPISVNQQNNITIPIANSRIWIKPISPWKPFYAFATGINYNISNYSISNMGSEFQSNLFGLEKGKIGLSSEFLYGKTNTKGWEWHVGIEHQLIVARYKNQTRSSSSSIIDGPKEGYINTQGMLDITHGPIQKTIINQNDITWHRRHQLVNVKLGVGKELLKLGNFVLGVRTDIGTTVFSTHSGYYFMKGESDITKIENKNHPYKRYGLIKGYGGLNIAYTWNQFTIGLQANYSLDINSSLKNTNYYSLKNSQYGIQITTRYRPY